MDTKFFKKKNAIAKDLFSKKYKPKVIKMDILFNEKEKFYCKRFIFKKI